MAYNHIGLSEQGSQPVAITKVDTETRRAEAMTRRRSTVTVDLRHHVGGMQVTPAVGEHWFIARADSFYYRLLYKIPYNAPEMLTEAVEGQVQVGSTGPLELHGERVNVNAEVLSLGDLELRGHEGELQRNIGTPEEPEWESLGRGGSGPVASSTDELPEGSENLYHTDQRAAAAAPVQSVAGRTGEVVLSKADVGLANVDNTSDVDRNTAPATLTNKTISGASNTLTNIALASVRELPTSLLGGSGVVIGGDFQDESVWANAFGEPYLDDALPGKTRSYQLTATGAGVNGDVLTLTHDGTGRPVFVPALGPRVLAWRFIIGKGWDNVGGGTIRIETRFEDFGSITSAVDYINADDIEMGMWEIWSFNHSTTAWRQAFQCRIILDSDIPVGDTFQLGMINIRDSGGLVHPVSVQTLTNKTLASPIVRADGVPATSTSPGRRGQVEWDANYVYVCVADNQWKRSPLSAW